MESAKRREREAELEFAAWAHLREALREAEQAESDYSKTFRLLQVHATTLLNLVTVEEFLAVERAGTAFLR